MWGDGEEAVAIATRRLLLECKRSHRDRTEIACMRYLLLLVRGVLLLPL